MDSENDLGFMGIVQNEVFVAMFRSYARLGGWMLCTSKINMRNGSPVGS